MDLVVETVGEVAVVEVKAEFLDASNSKPFKDRMATVCRASKKVVLDLGHVGFIDSTGCGALLTCLKQLTADGGDMKLCNITKPVRALFDLVRMQRILQICGTRDEAVQAFQAAST